MGTWFLQLMPEFIVLLQRCCKSENIDPHAARGRQKKTSATQHGKPIPKHEAKTCSFTAEVLQKRKYWFPRSMGTPQKKERHAAWETDSETWRKNMLFYCRGVAKMKTSIPTQCEDAKKKWAPRSAGIQQLLFDTPHEGNCKIWLGQYELNHTCHYTLPAKRQMNWRDKIKSINGVWTQKTNGFLIQQKQNATARTSTRRVCALTLPGTHASNGIWGESLVFFADYKYVILRTYKNVQNHAMWQCICVPVQNAMIPGSCKFAPGITYIGIFCFPNNEIENMYKTNIKTTNAAGIK